MRFERQDHLVYGRRGDFEVLLHFGLRRWGPVDFAVVVNERQVLALLISIGSLHRVPVEHSHGFFPLPSLRSPDQGKIPRQQFLDAVNWVISDTREHFA